MPPSIPAPPEAGIVNGLRFATQTVRFLEGVQARYEDAVRVPVPGRAPLVVLTNPDLAHDALGRPEEFGRVPVQDTAALIAERGLVQSEGDLWRQQRRLMAPGFSGRQVAAYANAVGERAEAVAGEWAAAGEQSVNLHGEMTRLTIRVASEVLMGEDVGRRRAEQFYDWMEVTGREFEFGLDVLQPDWFPQRISDEFAAAADGIRGLAEELIEGRREALAAGEGTDGPPDVLTILLRAADDPDVEFPPNQIRDEIATLLIAGHETTALSTAYTLALLSQHPEARERVRAEAREVLGEGPPTADDVEDLTYTRRVYDEALRLYPPAWAVFRRATADLRLGEYVVPEDAAVIVPLWSIQRDGRYFEEPDAFDPSRWERRDPTEVDAYFPFSTGPHACVGRNFALSGATLTIARLVRDFDVDVPASALEDLRLTPTLRPTDGVPATVRPVER